MVKRKVVIFSELDGFLLDDNGCVRDCVTDALAKLRESDIPIVLASRRTRAELEYYRDKLKISHPFISENGGGTFVPRDYFPFSFLYSKTDEKYNILELGLPYEKIRKIFQGIKSRLEYDTKGVGDMELEKVSEVLGISIEDAALAKKREYEEPFVLDYPDEQEGDILDCIRWADVNMKKFSGYYCLAGENDIGKAVRLLVDLYEKVFGDILLVGIGSGKSDLSLLLRARLPILLSCGKNDVIHPEELNLNAQRIESAGPVGWSEAVIGVVDRFA